MEIQSRPDASALIIAFLRTRNVIELLECCARNGVSKVYLAIDGPRNNEELKIQNSLIHDAKTISLLRKIDLTLWHRSENLGVAVGCISAIDWFFQFEKKGIILEDDLELSDQFFKFTNDNLTKYELNQNIWMISGTQFFPISEENLDNEYSNYPVFWGWATWSYKWAKMREAYYFEFINYGFLPNRKNLLRNYWKIGAKRCRLGIIDTWDIPVAALMWGKNKLCLLPRSNLVTNIGSDSVAVHTKKSEWPLHMKKYEDVSTFIKDGDNSIALAEVYNYKLENYVFKLKSYNFFLPIYAPLVDFFRKTKHKNGIALSMRVEAAAKI